MYFKISPNPVNGVHSAGVYERSPKDGSGTIVATLYNSDPKKLKAWAEAIANGALDRLIEEPAPAETLDPVEEAPPEAEVPATKSAQTLAANNGVNLADVPYTGNRITKADVEAHILKYAHAGVDPSPVEAEAAPETLSPSDG